MPEKPNTVLTDEINDLFGEITKKYDTIPKIQYFGPKVNHPKWSIRIDGHHLHDKTKDGKAGASISTFMAFGNTLKEAVEKLLKLEETHLISKGNNCEKGCPHYYDNDLY